MSTRPSDQSSQDFYPPLEEPGRGIATEIQTRFPATRAIEVASGTVLTTPSCPEYRDGNMTYLREPPSPSEDWIWRAAETVAEHNVTHVKIGWEQPLNSEPIAIGEPFVTNVDVVMKRGLRKSTNPDPAYRELTTDSDIDQMVELDATCAMEWGWPPDFTAWYSNQNRIQIKRGTARWFGMRDAGQIVATAGLVATTEGLRFQDVQTHPDARRKGWATRLLTSMLGESSDGKAMSNDSCPTASPEFLIVANQGDIAEEVYGRLGFKPIGQLVTATVLTDEPAS